MKNYFCIIFVSIILGACSKIQAPVFKTVTDLTVNTKDSIISVDGNGVFYNPNKSRIFLKSADIQVFINDQYFTAISRDFNLALVPESEFSIPLDIKLNNDQVHRFLKKNAIPLLMGNGIHFRYKGNIRVKAYHMGLKVPVNREVSINLKNFL